MSAAAEVKRITTNYVAKNESIREKDFNAYSL